MSKEKVDRNLVAARFAPRYFASVASLYLRHPRLAVAHAKRASEIVRRGGLASLSQILRNRVSAYGGEVSRRNDIQVAHQTLQRLHANRSRNVEVNLNALLPFASDLSVLEVVHDPHERLKLVQAHLLKKLGLLDEAMYRRMYLREGSLFTPIDHYLKVGLKRGCAPNLFFNPVTYLQSYPDVVDVGMDPVLHFALFGWRENRLAGVLFDPDYYLDANPDVKEAGLAPFVHFMKYGQYEKRSPRPQGASGQALAAPGGLVHSSGTLLIVSHDAELGGAQQVVKVLAAWLQAATGYDVRIVATRGGPFITKFGEIAPTLDLSGIPQEDVEERLRAFAGNDVKAIFLNSIASAGFLKHWTDTSTPVLGFIHELPRILERYPENIQLLRERADTVIGGSEAVRTALRDQFGFEAERLETVYGFIEQMPKGNEKSLAGKVDAKKALGIDPDTVLVTACGVLHWRKSPEKFVEVAEQVLEQHGSNVEFIWIGGGEDQAKCEKLVRQKGLSGKVRFTGYEPEIMRYLWASDIFLLTSEEDPFPLVCLYAARALNPVICFKEAGGMPEFVGNDCGRSVDFGSVEQMSAAVLEYLEDRNLREQHGKAARQRAEEGYTIATTGPQLLHHIRTAAGLKPHVSVVVPNYNYEAYLPERLQTICDQSFQDFELILLDDCSKDDSVALMEEWTRNRPGTKLIVNEKNTGSPFAQWIRGIREAESDLIWIAEADDACEPDLLETLLPTFDDRNTVLSYVKSVPIDAKGKVLGDYEDLYLNRISAGRWSEPYSATDYEEANTGLGIANCIPNASSVMFRRFDPEPEFEKTVIGMRMCGDWLFYLRAMKGGLVSYSNKPLNRHRRHSGTVTHSMEGSPRYFDEFAIVRDYVSSTYSLKDEALSKIEAFMEQDFVRFGIKEQDRKQLRARSMETTAKTLPSIMVVASDLSPGGGQMFAIRLANGWMRRGGRAVLVNVGRFPDHERVRSTVDPRVAIFDVAAGDVKLAELVERFDLDLIHTSLWWSERFVHSQIQDLDGVPWVTSMHGCHDTIIKHPKVDLSFPGRMKEMLGRLDHWVHTADKNRRVFEKYGQPLAQSRILNGVEAGKVDAYSREYLGLRESAVVLCLAARAIEEKGWYQAVDVTEKLNAEGHDVDLMLIGEGPIADEIRERAPSHVHLYGQVSDLQNYIAASDIGLLPSFFVGESMPLVMLEMMAQAKPIVATDVGEIPTMLGKGKQAGGIVVPLSKGSVDEPAYLDAVRSLLDDAKRAKLGAAAKRRYESEFTLDQMLSNYEKLYRSLLANEEHKEQPSHVDAAE